MNEGIICNLGGGNGVCGGCTNTCGFACGPYGGCNATVYGMVATFV